MTAPELYRRAQSLGLHLEADGDDLLVRPRSKVPPDFVDLLRAHKAELLDWLSINTPFPSPEVFCRWPRQTTGSAPGETVAWCHVARQILAGEFDGADKATCEALIIGLRSIPHPACRRALGILTP